MAETTNITLNRADGWQKVASNPDAVTIKCNFAYEGDEWFLAVTPTDTEPTVPGEQHSGAVSWVSGPIDGFVWLRSNFPRSFSITKEEQ